VTTATTTWTLLGIDHTRGTCDHCGRTLTRRFRIQGPDGTISHVGSTHAKQMTGWSWTVAQAEHAERRTRAETAAAADFGALWAEAVAQRDLEVAVTGRAGAAGEAVTALRDRAVPGDLFGFVADCLATSRATVGAA
jgi:hypothetical protein